MNARLLRNLLAVRRPLRLGVSRFRGMAANRLNFSNKKVHYGVNYSEQLKAQAQSSFRQIKSKLSMPNLALSRSMHKPLLNPILSMQGSALRVHSTAARETKEALVPRDLNRPCDSSDPKVYSKDILEAIEAIKGFLACRPRHIEARATECVFDKIIKIFPKNEDEINLVYPLLKEMMGTKWRYETEDNHVTYLETKDSLLAYYALCNAAYMGNLEIIKLLMQCGVNYWYMPYKTPLDRLKKSRPVMTDEAEIKALERSIEYLEKNAPLRPKVNPFFFTKPIKDPEQAPLLQPESQRESKNNGYKL